MVRSFALPPTLWSRRPACILDPKHLVQPVRPHHKSPQNWRRAELSSPRHTGGRVMSTQVFDGRGTQLCRGSTGRCLWNTLLAVPLAQARSQQSNLRRWIETRYAAWKAMLQIGFGNSVVSTDRGVAMAFNRGVVYIKPGEVQVQSIDFPKLEDPTNGKDIEHGVLLKIVSTNICGSDQHMVRGRTTAPAGPGSGARNHRRSDRNRPRRAVYQEGRPRLRALQHRLRAVPQLQGRQDGHLPEREQVAARAPPTATSTWAAGSAARPST